MVPPFRGFIICMIFKEGEFLCKECVRISIVYPP